MSKNNENNWEVGREVRYFNGTFRKMRLDRGWKQEELGELLGVESSTISSWERLRAVPSEKYRDKLEKIFGKKFEEMFPEFLEMFKNRRTTEVEYAELTPQMLEAHEEEKMLLGEGEPSLEVQFARRDLSDRMKKVMGTVLSDREQKILNLRFGFDGGRPHTLEEVGFEYSVTRDRVRQIEARAIGKLRRAIMKTDIRDEASLAYDISRPTPKKVVVPVKTMPKSDRWWEK